MSYTKITPPSVGQAITRGADGKLNIPDHPIIPFIEGDGIGIDGGEGIGFVGGCPVCAGEFVEE